MKTQIARSGARLSLTMMLSLAALPAAAKSSHSGTAAKVACQDLKDVYAQNRDKDHALVNRLAELCAQDKRGASATSKYIVWLGKLLPYSLARVEVAGR